MQSGTLGLSRDAASPDQPLPNRVYNDTNLFNRSLNSTNLSASRYQPPEPLTEFQEFVASTTGQVLPIYGASLFRNPASTFAPLDLTPVPADYAIGPGDELHIRIWGHVNLSANLRVDRSGDIYLPQVGPVHVAGLPYADLQQHLHEAVGSIYRNFDLSVEIGQIRAIQVYVTGEVRHPGLYTVSALSTLANVLLTSGGPSLQGSMRHAQLKRDGKLVTDFDLYNLLLRGDKTQDVPLLSGDIVFVPSVGPQVALTGSVGRPAIYELRNDETVGELLKDAAGDSGIAAETRISIDRIENHKDRMSMEVAYDAAGLATPLAQGDVLRVFPIELSFAKTVTLRGSIASPGRFAWKKGMRLSDLIPDRNSLLAPDYWWKRTQLGLPSPLFEPLDHFLHLQQPTNPLELPLTNEEKQRYRQLHTPGSPDVIDLNPENKQAPNAPGARMAGRGLDPNQAQYQGQYQAQYQSQDTEQDPQQYLEQNAQQPSGMNPEGTGQSSHSAQTSVTPPRQTDVRLTVPEINWKYAVIERTDPETLRTSLIPFDLGRLVIEHDNSQNLELESGDVVTIFSQADIRVPLVQQTKYVRLEGEVLHAGIYSVHPGDTLQSLIRQAGGLTADAYLYGSVFTRRSTRQMQQQRINDYVQKLEIEMMRGSLSVSASPVSTPQDVAGISAVQGIEHDLISRLHQIRATGRIVLEFKPDSTGLDSIPKMSLENGDSFIIPPLPEVVNIVGSVNNQTSFVYRQSRSAEFYLRLAGGPNRNADAKHAFVIRADGSVISRSASSMLGNNAFKQLAMYPGDTIVIPEKTIGISAVRGLIDWSQVFSQLALGVTAIDVLR